MSALWWRHAKSAKACQDRWRRDFFNILFFSICLNSFYVWITTFYNYFWLLIARANNKELYLKIWAQLAHPGRGGRGQGWGRKCWDREGEETNSFLFADFLANFRLCLKNPRADSPPPPPDYILTGLANKNSVCPTYNYMSLPPSPPSPLTTHPTTARHFCFIFSINFYGIIYVLQCRGGAEREREKKHDFMGQGCINGQAKEQPPPLPINSLRLYL